MPKDRLGDAPIEDEYIEKMNAIAGILNDVFRRI
jgi:hypothetical protein